MQRCSLSIDALGYADLDYRRPRRQLDLVVVEVRGEIVAHHFTLSRPRPLFSVVLLPGLPPRRGPAPAFDGLRSIASLARRCFLFISLVSRWVGVRPAFGSSPAFPIPRCAGEK